MPDAYGKLFLDFFYHNAVPYAFNDCPGFLEIASVFDVLNEDKGKPISGGDTHSLSNAISMNSILLHHERNFAQNTLMIVPYAAQQKFYKVNQSILGDARVLTLRPSQGTEADHVYFDPVSVRPSRKFISNNVMVVVLSRFKRRLFLSHTYVPNLEEQNLQFKFDPSTPIWTNYQRFVASFDRSKVGLSYLDDNGDFKYKWVFFLALLEKFAFAYSDKARDASKSMFAYMASYKMNQNDDVSDCDDVPLADLPKKVRFAEFDEVKYF